MPLLAEPHAGESSWMAACVPATMELLRRPRRVHWVHDALDGRSLQELAEDMCGVARGSSRTNRENIVDYLRWLEGQSLALRAQEEARHWSELERIRDEMRRLGE
ncbi:unnamed protein product, partial [Prorocentrum cordatum]